MQRRIFAIAALAAACAAHTASAAGPPREAAEAPAAWVAAYDSMNGATAAAMYTPDATLWGSVSRSRTIGTAAISDYFGRTRPGVAATSVTLGDYTLREVAPGVAVASGLYTFHRRLNDGSASSDPSRFSMTFVRGTDGLWRIADHHSSRLPAPPR
ncbi:SgcJ/EcaC family oxidoreductase [Roseomonas rosulenta]|uniref:SgcJ/EcaC family oxidoreductase n=1 Tax=Roseomonas rosulenta TaxID=2748667 RepID=UPI0018E05874|nr:SgcJ/EcaC family oxidoreductase [Roseomonas rosulenta]